MDSAYPMYDMIRTLRQEEQIILYANILEIQPPDLEKTVEFLAAEYQAECFSYPHTPPAFDPEAASWGARYVYTASQVILFRQALDPLTDAFLKEDGPECSSASILSADLCLRFLPDILDQLHAIDSLDPLRPVLENRLEKWHYSGIRYDLENCLSDRCLAQLYAERVVRCKKLQLAAKSELYPLIKSFMGIHEQSYWNEFTLIASHESH